MTISRRALIAAFGAAPAAGLFPRTAFAAYPERPIHLIVPFAPGGNADIVGRMVGEEISKALGQPVVVDNRGGAGGAIGAEAVARATPDGYTLFVGSNGPLTVNPFVQAQLPLRSAEGFRADRADELRAARASSSTTRSRPRRLPELIALSKKAAAQRRDQRRRQRHAHDARALQGGDRRQHHARALSRAAAR